MVFLNKLDHLQYKAIKLLRVIWHPLIFMFSFWNKRSFSLIVLTFRMIKPFLLQCYSHPTWTCFKVPYVLYQTSPPFTEELNFNTDSSCSYRPSWSFSQNSKLNEIFLIFSSEIAAINIVVNLSIAKNLDHAVICSDSKSTLQNPSFKSIDRFSK